MPSFLSVLQGVAKFNKVFTIANVAFDASITGVTIAQAVDPESVCVAWDVKDLSMEAFDKGEIYDELLDQIAQTSTDMENITQAILNVQTITQSLTTRWEEVSDIRSKIDEINSSLSSQVPAAYTWLLTLKGFDGDTASQVEKVTDQLKANGVDVAISSSLFGASVLVLVGAAVYRKKYAKPPSRSKLLSDSKDPKWRLKEVQKAAVSTLFNVGSFAMNILIVINLAKQCQQQADTLKDMINTYKEKTPTLKYLLNGCENETQLDIVKNYLKTITNDELSSNDDNSSFDDDESQEVLKDGLVATLSNYNTDINGWMTDLDGIYQMILDIFNAAADVGSASKDVAQDLNSSYKDFVEEKTGLTDTTKTSGTRLQESRKMVETSKIFSDTTNSVVAEYQVALADAEAAQYLVNKAEVIAGRESRLEEFNEDKLTYVVLEEFLEDLENLYENRSLFKAEDEQSANQQIADFMDQAIQDILNPEATTVSSLLGNYENHLYDDKGGKNNWHYVTISQVDDSTLKWENRAGVSWTLTTTSDKTTLDVGTDCPYFQQGYQQATVVWNGTQVSELMGPGNEPYQKSST